MFAMCELPIMQERDFIAAQLAGLKRLGLEDVTLSREERLLSAAFAQRALLTGREAETPRHE
jgi:hypothetical protein